MENCFIDILCSFISLGVAFIAPVLYKKIKTEEESIRREIGNSAYGACKQYLLDLAKIRPESFYEDALVVLLEDVNLKFGDHLSANTIKMLVDFVKNTIETEIKHT